MMKIKNKYLNVFLLLLSLVFSFGLTIQIVNNQLTLTNFRFDFWLFILLTILSFFLVAHLLFPLKKLYEFLDAKRFLIALIIFIILVLGKFHGSSYGMWDAYIEPNNPVSSLTPLIGEPRSIRSDEWLVNSSYVQSQIETGFHYFNPVMRHIDTDVFATVPAPLNSILVITKPFLIGYLLFGRDYGMAFYWWGRLIVLFLVTYELFKILKKDKLPSLLGAILVTFSPAIFWWYSQYLVEQLIGGSLAIIMFYHFLRANKWQKGLYALLIGLGFSIFLFTLYPAWLVPLGFFYLILAIYLLYDYYRSQKFHLRDLLPLTITIVFVLILLIVFFHNSYDTYKILMNTVYPGQRLSVLGTGIKLLFYYPATILFPYLKMANPCECSTFYSLFPLSLILAIYVLFKERKNLKNNLLLFSLTILSCIYTLLTIFKIPVFLAKMTMLSNVTGERLSLILSMICIYLLILSFDKINLKTKTEKWLMIGIGLLLGIFVLYQAYKTIPDNYLTIKTTILCGLPLLIIIVGLVYQSAFSKVILYGMLIGVSFLATVYVNPLMKGFSGIYEKPLSKELRKYQNEDATWISLDSFVIPNYLGMHGLKVINATNVYPNLELWSKLDPQEENKEIYNRYAHITVVLNKDETSFTYLGPDQFRVNLNPVDVCTLKVDYLSSLNDITSFNQKNVNFQLIYKNDNINLYKVNCLGGQG